MDELLELVLGAAGSWNNEINGLLSQFPVNRALWLIQCQIL